MISSKILVTGAAGFIGMHLVKSLLQKGHKVLGIDNLNDYYEIELKEARLKELGVDAKDIVPRVSTNSSKYDNFIFEKCELENFENLEFVFESYEFDIIINLAAQAGVRYSLENPHVYIQSNINGFVNLLELSKNYNIKHLIYASSSSVYGLSDQIPFSTDQNVDNPISVYAATKKSNELLAHVYSHLYGLPTTGLRFFTVYGPWGRPDMAYFSFTKSILKGDEIKVFNGGDMRRDFTYIDDIVEAITKLIDCHSVQQPPYQLFNIGNSNPVKLLDFITILENKLGREANKRYLPMQLGDVYSTYADVTPLEKIIGYKPSTTIEQGLEKFVNWYLEYYN